MHILVTSLPDLKKINPQRPQQLLSYLSKKHEVTVFSVNAWWLKRRADSYLDSLLSDVQFAYITDRQLHPVLQELRLIRHFDTVTKGQSFDLHVNVNSLIAGFHISKKLKKQKVPTIFDVADDLPERIKSSAQIPNPLRPTAYRVALYLFERCMDVAAGNTVVTNALLQSYHFPLSKSVVIPNGVDVDLFQDLSDSPLRSELGIEQDFIIGFAGVLGPWVDLDQTFAALRELHDAGYNMRMLIVGDGEKQGQLRAAVRRFGIDENVLFVGGVSQRELPRYIACMDVCLVSYRVDKAINNSFPLKLLEYMACGKPVISIDVRGVHEVAGNRVLYATSAEEIKRTLKDLYADQSKRKTLGLDALKFVREHYRWELAGADFERIALQIVEHG